MLQKDNTLILGPEHKTHDLSWWHFR